MEQANWRQVTATVGVTSRFGLKGQNALPRHSGERQQLSIVSKPSMEL